MAGIDNEQWILRRAIMDMAEKQGHHSYPRDPCKRLVELSPAYAAEVAQSLADYRTGLLCDAYDLRESKEQIEADKLSADWYEYAIRALVEAGAKPPISRPCDPHHRLTKPLQFP